MRHVGVEDIDGTTPGAVCLSAMEDEVLAPVCNRRVAVAFECKDVAAELDRILADGAARASSIGAPDLARATSVDGLTQ